MTSDWALIGSAGIIGITALVGLSLLVLRRPHYSPWVIMGVFVALPEYQINQNLPIYLTTYLFEVRMLGVNLIELVILWIGGLLLIRRVMLDKPGPVYGIENRWLWYIALVWGAAFLHGIGRWMLAPVGDTTIFSPFGAFAPIVYIFTIALLVQQFTRTAEQMEWQFRAFWIFLWCLVLCGIGRFILIELGIIETLVIRLPIVLYRPANLLIFIVTLAAVTHRFGLPFRQRPNWFLLLWTVIFLFLTTRRIVYILAVGAPVLALWLGWWSGTLPRLGALIRLRRLCGYAALLVVLAFLLPMDTVAIFIDTFYSINIWSEVGIRMASGAERVAQVENLFANLQVENGHLFGLGLGTYWNEYIAVPHASNTGFDSMLARGATSFPAFVLPGINLLYRLGWLGTPLMLFLLWKFLQRHLSHIRRIGEPLCRARYLALLANVMIFLFFLGDTRSPSTIFSGLVLGLLEGMRHVYGRADSPVHIAQGPGHGA